MSSSVGGTERGQKGDGQGSQEASREADLGCSVVPSWVDGGCERREQSQVVPEGRSDTVDRMPHFQSTLFFKMFQGGLCPTRCYMLIMEM